MNIDRSYRGRRRRSPWPIIALIFIMAAGIYLLATRTRFFENPLNPFQPTPTPTRTAISYLAEAEDLTNAGRWAEAADAYANVARLEPDNDEAYRQQAWLWLLLGHAEKAVPLAEQASEIKPSAMNLVIHAMTLDWHGEVDAAIELALKAVDADPLLPEAHAVLAEIYADKNNWTRALEEAELAVELDAENAIVQRNLGYVLERQGRYLDAIDAYERAAALAPKLGYILVGAGHCYLAMGDNESALKQFERAAEADPNSPVGLDALGHGSALAGDPDRAISVLKKTIELDPTYGPAFAHLGRVYYTQLNWEAAIEYFTQAMDLGVENEEYYYEFGLAYSYLDDCGNAVIWLEKALDLNANSAPAWEGLRRCSEG